MSRLRANGSIATRQEIVDYLSSVLAEKRTLNLQKHTVNSTLKDQLSRGLLRSRGINYRHFTFEHLNSNHDFVEFSRVTNKFQACLFFSQLYHYAVWCLTNPTSAQVTEGWAFDYGANTSASDSWQARRCDDGSSVGAELRAKTCFHGLGVNYYERSAFPFLYLDAPSGAEDVLSWQENKPIRVIPKGSFYDKGSITGKIVREDIRSDITDQFQGADTVIFDQPAIRAQDPAFFVDYMLLGAILALDIPDAQQSGPENAVFPRSIAQLFLPKQNGELPTDLIQKERADALRAVFSAFLTPAGTLNITNPNTDMGAFIFDCFANIYKQQVPNSTQAQLEAQVVRLANNTYLKVKSLKQRDATNSPFLTGTQALSGIFQATFTNLPPIFETFCNGSLSNVSPISEVQQVDPLGFFMILAWLGANMGFGYGTQAATTRKFYNNEKYRTRGEPLVHMYSQWLVNRFGGSTEYAPNENWQGDIPTEEFELAQIFIPDVGIGTRYDHLLDLIGSGGEVIRGGQAESLPSEPALDIETTPFAESGSVSVLKQTETKPMNVALWLLGAGLLVGGSYFAWKKYKSE